MSSYCILQVLRAEDVVWAFSSLAKQPNLYVKVTLGTTVQKTDVIKKKIAPSWNTTLTLPTDGTSEAEDLTVELKHSSSLPRNRSIGLAVIKVKKLLADSVSGEVKVELRSSDSSPSATMGIVFLRMKAADGRQAAERNLDGAQSAVAGLTHSAPASGLDGTEENKGLEQHVVDLAQKVDEFVKFMDKVAAFNPYLTVTWALVSSLQKAIKGQADDDKEVIDLVRCMKEIFETIKALDSVRNKHNCLHDNMIEFFKQSSECCTFIREYTGHGFTRRILKIGAHDKIQEFRGRFNELKTTLTSGTTMHLAFVSARIMERVDLTYLERQLRPTEMDASNRPQCLPGTRTEILKEIMGWVFSDMDTNMLWLHGVAGSGKSTVSTTIAKYCFGMNRQGAHVFFVRGKSKPNPVIREIAFRLASFDPSIAEHVAAAVEKNNGISEAPLESQFEKLLLEPLRAAADAMTGPVVVVLDALDECGTPDERARLMKLLREEFPKLPPVFRFIVTSRPEPDLTEAFSASQSVFAVGLDYMSKTSKDDVSRYLDVEMRAIMRGQHQHVQLDWEEAMETLGKSADGLFIWASTAVKMVKQSDEPAEELEDLVEFCRSRSYTPQAEATFSLNQLYDTVLENSGIQWHKPRSRERFAQVLGLILFSKALVTPRTIDGLTGLSSRNILTRLASVLAYSPENPDMPVRLFHTSFSDYLLAPERKEQRWFIDVSEQRLLLPARCFDIMADKLCFNICGLESSFVANDKIPGLETRIKERIPSHLQYACRYWAEHVCDVSAQASSKLTHQLTVFVEQHLLYWFEALSLMKHFDHVAHRSLYDVSLWAGPDWPDISSLVWSAFRFASIFSYPMSRSAPHVYLSALSLGMKDFAFAERYAEVFPVIRSQRFGTKPPQPCLKVLSGGHNSFVRSVAFSLDGRRVASGSSDGTVCIWDVHSGNLISGPFSGHEDSVLLVAFSQDGRRIASGSYDKTIRMWDVDYGKVFSHPLKGHTGYISSMAFSSDVGRIASGLDDKTIRIWDVNSGKVVADPIQGHEGRVTSVAFSPDGRRVASGSFDGIVCVWDVESGKLIAGPFKGHVEFVLSVTFSPDGRLIASGSGDNTIRVWDINSGKLISRLSEGFKGWVRSVAFSPDGRCIASGSDDAMVRLWSVDSGELLAGPFEGHEGRVYSVSFSPDGRRIASGSEDRTIRVWDVDSGKLGACPFQGHEDRVNSVAFLRDGRRIVTGSDDKTIRIWDVDSGKLDAGPLQGHEGHVWSVAVSPDGRCIASGSRDKTIRLWDVDSSRTIAGPFRGHKDWIESVAFSPDGRRIVSGSHDKTISIWDVDSGKLVAGPFQGHVDSVWSVAFSPCGRFIASGSSDKTICVWNADSGKLVAGPFEGHEASVRSVAYSQDGRRIASGSSDDTIRVWDVNSSKMVAGPFRGHKDWVQSVTFSPDGRHIASGSDDKTIRIWDVDSGKLDAGPFQGHAGGVRSVVFSPDGRRIASSSSDKTIRVWDVGYGKVLSNPLKGQLGYVSSIAVPSDGERIASGSSGGAIRTGDGKRPIDMAIASVEDVRSNAENVDISEPEHSHKSSFEKPRSQPAREQICRAPSWIISEDGWLLGESGELIIWIPEDIRRTLWHPSTTAIMSCRFYTKLDFTGARLGESWHEGYPIKRSE